MNNEMQNRIDAFLRGEMSQGERDAFERELASDSNLAEQLELTIKIREALGRRHSKIEKMKVWEKDIVQEPSPRKHDLHRWSLVIGGMVACLLIGYLVIVPQKETYIYDAAFFRSELNYRGGENFGGVDRRMNSQDYAGALAVIDSLEKAYQWELSQLPLDGSEENLYNRQVVKETMYQLSWRRLQAYLAQGEVENALLLLEDFRHLKGEYQTKSQILWEQLKSGY